MNEEQRRLLLARQTWRSMHPTEMDVLRAAKRIATRFQPRRSLSFGRRVRMVSGALATIAGIAYAGSGAWSEIAGKLGRGHAARALADEQTTSVESRTSGPHDPKAERVGVVPEHLAVDAVVLPAVEAVPKPRKKVVRAVAPRARRAESADANKELTASVDRIDNPSWADVNAALGALDYQRAESLLLQLAEGWRDADTRAKAHLGLAQLAASRGDCERARVLALGVAAAPGIEMKTVRRALELAVRCAR
jgi:hypothetical protein